MNDLTRLEISFDTFWHETYSNATMDESLEQAIRAISPEWSSLLRRCLKRAYLSWAEYIVNRIEENV